MKYIKNKLTIFALSLLIFTILLICLKPILETNSLIFPYSIHPFDIVKKYPKLWLNIKIIYCINLFITIFLIINSIYLFFILQKTKNKKNNSKEKKYNYNTNNSFNLLIGNTSVNNKPIYIPEKGLYQNILITGTIGSRKNQLCNVSYS